ncbi:hypothetical protein [Calothrix sp. NIES-2098]|uniref:hypothetical protein n=1 Tax=Calothrix sp. NIES-2098 TaxID=1954171 RepID=UPI000B603BAA|nr:hypothetical protein NIES2098_04830 [Calothrix sp. NIES-2098]
MDLSIQTKIIALWVVFLFGMVFHSQLGFMPILYGEDVTMASYKGKMPVSHPWLMLGFFVIPMIAITTTVFYDFYLYRVIHFGITVLYTVMNFIHAAMDLTVRPIEWYQIALMVIVFINGIFLNILAYQWMQ